MKTWTSKGMQALRTAGAAVCFGLLAAPAMASSVIQPPVSVPEPGTLSLLAAGAAGVAVVSRFRRRK